MDREKKRQTFEIIYEDVEIISFVAEEPQETQYTIRFHGAPQKMVN